MPPVVGPAIVTERATGLIVTIAVLDAVAAFASVTVTLMVKLPFAV